MSLRLFDVHDYLKPLTIQDIPTQFSLIVLGTGMQSSW